MDQPNQNQTPQPTQKVTTQEELEKSRLDLNKLELESGQLDSKSTDYNQKKDEIERKKKEQQNKISSLENKLREEQKELTRDNLTKYVNNKERLSNIINEQIKIKKSEDSHRKSYITVNRFYIEIESEVRASFTECSGLGVNIKKETYLEGGVNDQQRIVLGHAEFTDVTLKRGMTDDLAFWGWITFALTGQPSSRRNVNILLFNQAGETMMCWTLIGAIPISWKAPGFQADGNSVAIEEVTLAYEGLQVKTAQGSGGATVGLGRDLLGFFPSH
ncbi:MULTISPECIES: phage tail protein [unclassified Microcoleus]|uniref:phage tail protein n=1 Tax=unclassified Microcoleus TaxID=2642155 RepID=UPI002FD6CD5C